jgi:hypothetical protein
MPKLGIKAGDASLDMAQQLVEYETVARSKFPLAGIEAFFAAGLESATARRSTP